MTKENQVIFSCTSCCCWSIDKTQNVSSYAWLYLALQQERKWECALVLGLIGSADVSSKSRDPLAGKAFKRKRTARLWDRRLWCTCFAWLGHMVALHCLPAAPIRGLSTDSLGSLLSERWTPATPSRTCPLCLGNFPDKRGYLPSQYGQSSSRCKVTRLTSSTARPNATFLDSHQSQKSPKCAKCRQNYLNSWRFTNAFRLVNDSTLLGAVTIWLFLVYQSLSLLEIDLLNLLYNFGRQNFGCK